MVTDCQLLSDWTLLSVSSFFPLTINGERLLHVASHLTDLRPPLTPPPPAPAPGMGAANQSSFPSVLCTQAPPSLRCSLRRLYFLRLPAGLTSAGWAAGSTAAGCTCRIFWFSPPSPEFLVSLSSKSFYLSVCSPHPSVINLLIYHCQHSRFWFVVGGFVLH